jgi:hypothetical protein
MMNLFRCPAWTEIFLVAAGTYRASYFIPVGFMWPEREAYNSSTSNFEFKKYRIYTSTPLCAFADWRKGDFSFTYAA